MKPLKEYNIGKINPKEIEMYLKGISFHNHLIFGELIRIIILMAFVILILLISIFFLEC